MQAVNKHMHVPARPNARADTCAGPSQMVKGIRTMLPHCCAQQRQQNFANKASARRPSAAPVCAVAIRVEQQRDVEVLAAHVWSDGELNDSLRVEGHRPEHIRVGLPAHSIQECRHQQDTQTEQLVEHTHKASVHRQHSLLSQRLKQHAEQHSLSGFAFAPNAP